MAGNFADTMNKPGFGVGVLHTGVNLEEARLPEANEGNQDLFTVCFGKVLLDTGGREIVMQVCGQKYPFVLLNRRANVDAENCHDSPVMEATRLRPDNAGNTVLLVGIENPFCADCLSASCPFGDPGLVEQGVPLFV